jgi:predicted metal-dependent hydrolase
MVRNYRNSKRVVTKTKREKREVDIRQEVGEALFLRQHNRTPH